MTKKQKHYSQFQLAILDFKRNRLAVFCVIILTILYGAAIFSDFLAPYSYDNEDRNYSYSQPAKIHV